MSLALTFLLGEMLLTGSPLGPWGPWPSGGTGAYEV